MFESSVPSFFGFFQRIAAYSSDISTSRWSRCLSSIDSSLVLRERKNADTIIQHTLLTAMRNQFPTCVLANCANMGTIKRRCNRTAKIILETNTITCVSESRNGTCARIFSFLVWERRKNGITKTASKIPYPTYPVKYEKAE